MGVKGLLIGSLLGGLFCSVVVILFIYMNHEWFSETVLKTLTHGLTASEALLFILLFPFFSLFVAGGLVSVAGVFGLVSGALIGVLV